MLDESARCPVCLGTGVLLDDACPLCEDVDPKRCAANPEHTASQDVTADVAGPVPHVQLVVAWYNEDLDWVDAVLSRIGGGEPKIYSKLHSEHGRYPVTPLPNVGRDTHSFLAHICGRYDDGLAPVTVLAPGSVSSGAWNGLKARKLQHAISSLDEVERRGVVYQAHTEPGSFLPFDPGFKITRWRSTSGANLKANPSKRLVRARARPFGAWYRKYISSDTSHIVKCGIAYNSVLAVSSHAIRSHPRSMYLELLDQHCDGTDLEVAHFFERVMLSLWTLQ